MCGACGHVRADPSVSGPRARAAVARTLSARSGLSVRVALGVWTVASPTGRTWICRTLDELTATVAEVSGVDVGKPW